MSTTTDLMGLGMAPALAALVATNSVMTNNTALQGTTTGAVAQNLIKIDGSDNTVVDSKSGKKVSLCVNATESLAVSSTAITTASNVTHTLTGTGAAATAGTFVCNGATPVTVTTTAANTNMIVLISLNTVGGTVGAIPTVKTITAATQFTVAGTAADTSTYNWAMINRA